MSAELDLNDASHGIETALATLQPLRDLAKNWDIDIASCLEEYLHELTLDLPPEERERVANAQGLNFAQAALVLQNSSNIYSRKVEYLYALVYKALDELAVKNRDSSKKKSGATLDPDVDDFLNFDPYQEFLLLDDILPTDDSDNCRKINLAAEPIDSARNNNAHETHYWSPYRSTTRLSIGNITDRSVSSANAAAYRALVGSLDTASLRLVGGACDIGDDGLLRMPGSSSARKDTLPPPPPADFFQSPPVPDMEFGTAAGDVDHDDDDGDNDDGVGFALADDFGEEMPDAQEPVTEPVKEKRRVTFADTVKDAPEKASDPWELLDPHTTDSYKPRPLRIGKTIRLPAGLTELPSECVTGARTRRVARRERAPALKEKAGASRSLVTETFKAVMANRKRHHDESNETGESTFHHEDKMERPAVPLKGLAFGNEFAYIAKATARRKAAELRERRKQLRVSSSNQADVGALQNDDGDDEDDGIGGFAFAGDEDDDDYGYDGGAFDNEDRGPTMGNTGLASVDDVYKSNYENEDDPNAGAQTFEELCRAHIRAFARGAEKYAAETKLSQRVGTWQDRLVPLLEEEEQRPVFDIHVYGNTVIEKVTEEIQKLNPKATDVETAPNKVVDFQEVTRQSPPYEVCRMFLASLSLSNSGNVELFCGNDDCTSLQIKLLKSDIERPMETYLAPSVAEDAGA